MSAPPGSLVGSWAAVAGVGIVGADGADVCSVQGCPGDGPEMQAELRHRQNWGGRGVVGTRDSYPFILLPNSEAGIL